MAVKQDIPMKDVNVKALQEQLIKDGCDLGI